MPTLCANEDISLPQIPQVSLKPVELTTQFWKTDGGSGQMKPGILLRELSERNGARETSQVVEIQKHAIVKTAWRRMEKP